MQVVPVASALPAPRPSPTLVRPAATVCALICALLLDQCLIRTVTGAMGAGPKSADARGAETLSDRIGNFHFPNEARLMQGKITKRTVEGLRPGAWLWDSAVTGFGAKGGKTGVFYYLRYRHGGREQYMAIGKHGSPWTPDTARAEARRLL